MWKWIGGCFLLCVVMVGVAGFWGIRKVKGLMDRPAVASVTIAASPERVFASMANADSLSTWMTTGAVVQHKGMLVVGDTFALHGSQMRTSGNRQSMTWTVTEIKSPTLIVFAIRSDSLGTHFATLRDSLVARGDSTEVIASYSMPFPDSVAVGDTGQKRAVPPALQSMFKLMLVGFTEMEKIQLNQLKERIEGKRVEATPVDTSKKSPDSTGKKGG
jgi:uncharacterized protein YndB with AHSA1/START domain